MKKYLLETSGFAGNRIKINEYDTSRNDHKILYTIEKNPVVKAGLFLISSFYNHVNYMLEGMNGNKDLRIENKGFNKHVIIEDDILIGKIKGKGFKLIYTKYKFEIVINDDHYFFESDSFFAKMIVYRNEEIIGKIHCISKPRVYPHFGKTDWSAEFEINIDIRIIAIGLLYTHLIFINAD